MRSIFSGYAPQQPQQPQPVYSTSPDTMFNIQFPPVQHNSKSVSYHKTKWLPVEDELLLNAVKMHGTKNWVAVSAAVPGRTAKQCRERYTGQLDPNLTKDEWTTEEDEKLLKLHSLHGNQWSHIARNLPGRSSTSVKNRCKWLIKRKINSQSTSPLSDFGSAQSQPLSAGSSTFSFSNTDSPFSDPFSESLSFASSYNKNAFSDGGEDSLTDTADDSPFNFPLEDTQDLWFDI